MIALSHVSATCPDCGHRVDQIDSSQEHAISVVRAAMEHHLETCSTTASCATSVAPTDDVAQLGLVETEPPGITA